MKKIFTVLLFAILLPCQSSADELADLQLEAEKYLQLTEAQWAFDESMKNAKSYMQQMINQEPETTPERAALKEQQTAEVMTLVEEELSWHKFQPAIIKLLINVYSLDDLKAINTFYDSEAGRNMTAKTPELAKQQMQMMQTLMVSMQENLKVLITKHASERQALSKAE
ncbi:MAG: DUF2059 domain-containing protein [Colwellia sp.]